MCESFVNINKIPTKVLMFGELISENCDQNSNELNDVILFIPGTIGITTFYAEFLETIHKDTGYPVWAIGHVGHDIYIDEKGIKHDVPPLENNGEIYGLQGQIDHKVAFIEKYVPKNTRIHFIAHSIGSYITLKLLEEPSISERVEECYYLFPAIEHMKKTRNGFIFGFIKLLLSIILFLTWIFTFLPVPVQSFLIYIYCCLHNRADVQHIDVIRNFLDPDVMDKIFFMLFDEMELVQERNNEMIKRNKDKMKFYYGKSDGWVPISYYRKLRQDIPTVNAELCTRNFQHHFVLHDSVPVGKMVASWFHKNNK